MNRDKKIVNKLNASVYGKGILAAFWYARKHFTAKAKAVIFTADSKHSLPAYQFTNNATATAAEIFGENCPKIFASVKNEMEAAYICRIMAGASRRVYCPNAMKANGKEYAVIMRDLNKKAREYNNRLATDDNFYHIEVEKLMGREAIKAVKAIKAYKNAKTENENIEKELAKNWIEVENNHNAELVRLMDEADEEMNAVA